MYINDCVKESNFTKINIITIMSIKSIISSSLYDLFSGYLNASVSDFSTGCVRMWEDVQRVVQDGPPSENIVRIIIDKYMNVERAFIHPEGLPGRSYFK